MPSLLASIIPRSVGEALEISTGTPLLATLSRISEEMRPLVIITASWRGIVLYQRLAEDLIEGVMAADVLVKNEDALRLGQGGAMGAVGEGVSAG